MLLPMPLVLNSYSPKAWRNESEHLGVCRDRQGGDVQQQSPRGCGRVYTTRTQRAKLCHSAFALCSMGKLLVNTEMFKAAKKACRTLFL